MDMLTAEQIQEILPHRYPFLMVDRILEVEEGKRAVGIKNVTINEAEDPLGSAGRISAELRKWGRG